MTEEQLLALASYEASDAFDALEKQVIAYAEALTRTPATTTDAQVEALREALDDEQLVELTAMISWENFRARFNRGFDVAEQGFSDGAVCALPESHPALGGG